MRHKEAELMNTDNSQPLPMELKLNRWMTRGISLITTGFYGIIMFAALVNEDPPSITGRYIIAGVMGCVLAIFLAWRWPLAGGVSILLMAVVVAMSVIASAIQQGYDGLATLLALCIYPVPAVLVGALFIADGQFDKQHERSP
jgi:hypothetical protein